MKVEFRDGEKEIPDYLADLMAGIETYRLTLREAIDEANAQMLGRYVTKLGQEAVDDHMRDLEQTR